MSTPFSSLQKHKKLPFQGCNMLVPFRKVLPTINTEIDNQLFDEALKESAAAEVQKFKVDVDRKLRSLYDNKSPRSDVLLDVQKSTSDRQLMMLMTTKLKELEAKAFAQAKEIVEKDEVIIRLQEKLKILELQQDSEKIKKLESKCFAQEQQIKEMEEFLSDYGLIWVGNECQEAYQAESQSKFLNSKILWHPESSVDSELFHFDFDLLSKNIKELNLLSCQGVFHVQKTVNGARLMQQDSVQLTVYTNGIFLFNGPFRDFSDPSTRQFIMDILDGYFPSELQCRYPDGVPFNYTDRRNVNYEEKRMNVFCGDGVKLGEAPKNEIHNNNDYQNKDITSTNHPQPSIPNLKLTADQFLTKLPESYIKQGEIINVREPIKRILQGSGVQRDAKAPISIERPISRSPRSHHLPVAMPTTRLRVRSETGEETYILTMKITDTIRQVRKLIDKERSSAELSRYDIVSAFPTIQCLDESATLQSLRLYPTASLHLKKIGPPLPSI